MKATYFLIFIIVSSCSTIKKQKAYSEKTESSASSIIFMVFNIHKDTTSKKNIVELKERLETSGKMKEPAANNNNLENSLTIYRYQDKKLVETMVIEHPLYKHVEYLDEHNQLSAKEFSLDHAEFFLRMEIKGNSNEIRIFEKLKNKTREALTEIKL